MASPSSGRRTARRRDAAGRPIALAQDYIFGPIFSATPSTYAYHPTSDRLRQVTNADGIHNMVYDARGLVQTMTVVGEGDYTFAYDTLGRNSTLTFPDGHRREQQYDLEGRITSRCYRYTSSTLDRCYTATYDAAGNPRTIVATVRAGSHFHRSHRDPGTGVTPTVPPGIGG